LENIRIHSLGAGNYQHQKINQNLNWRRKIFLLIIVHLI
jgi:hypothetical protein